MPKEQETSAAQVRPEAAARRICGKAGGRTRLSKDSENNLPVGCGRYAPIGNVISFDFAKRRRR